MTYLLKSLESLDDFPCACFFVEFLLLALVHAPQALVLLIYSLPRKTKAIIVTPLFLFLNNSEATFRVEFSLLSFK